MEKTEFTVREIAILTGVDKRIPLIWIKKGKLESSWDGKKNIVSLEEAVKLVQSRGLVWKERILLLFGESTTSKQTPEKKTVRTPKKGLKEFMTVDEASRTSGIPAWELLPAFYSGSLKGKVIDEEIHISKESLDHFPRGPAMRALRFESLRRR